MNKENLSSEALLSNDGDMTSFRYGNNNIRFRSPKCLKRYTEVKEWDNGYIVVMADYEGLGEKEEEIKIVAEKIDGKSIFSGWRKYHSGC